MAIMSIDLFSQSLGRTVTVRAILPTDKRDMVGKFLHEEKPLKALYLLHGIFGNESDWINGTRISEWAQSANLAVFMPAGENKFYVNQENGSEQYGTFIGEELVELTRRMFPLSRKREDTLIAGLSMGGYGAIRNGLVYHETFGTIGALSSALIIEDIPLAIEDAPVSFQRKSYYEAIFGDVNQVIGSDKDPKALVLSLKKEQVSMPKIYMACGSEDFLVQKNRDFVSFLKEQAVQVTYEEGEGTHSWEFWNTYIKRFLDWLALEESKQGINSGHIQ